MKPPVRIPRLIIILSALIIGIGAVFWFMPSRGDSGKRYEKIPVTRGDIEEVVTAQGKLEPKEFVDVGSQVSGQLLKLHVEIGDTVKKGDLIAEIDPKIYVTRVEADEARLKTLRAQLAEQQAGITYTQSVYKRNQGLIKQDAISKDALSASEKEFKAASARAASLRAQIEEAESTLEGDKANLNYTNIYAPIDGTVVSQSAKEGQTLNANQTAPVIVQLAKLDIMTVRAQVAEADVSRLKEGMEVYFTTLGSERRWQGKVQQILPSPDATVTDVILYNALVDVDNTDRSLMTGMSTQMFFVLGRVENVLTIPVRALGKKTPKKNNGQGEAYEVLKSNGKVEPAEIHVGLMSRTLVEIKSGLAEGDKVAVPMAPAAGASSGGGQRRSMGPRI